MPDTSPTTFIGTDAPDNFTATDGTNRIVGGGGNDRLVGGAGADNISGGGGNDAISGGQGNDIIYGGRGDDIINGGKDFDRAVYNGDISQYTFTVDKLGRLHITDTVAGRDGADIVTNVEEFNFNHVIYSFFDVTGLPFAGF